MNDETFLVWQNTLVQRDICLRTICEGKTLKKEDKVGTEQEMFLEGKKSK